MEKTIKFIILTLNYIGVIILCLIVISLGQYLITSKIVQLKWVLIQKL